MNKKEFRYCLVKFDGGSRSYEVIDTTANGVEVGNTVLIKCATGFQLVTVVKTDTDGKYCNGKSYVVCDATRRDELITDELEKEYELEDEVVEAIYNTADMFDLFETEEEVEDFIETIEEQVNAILKEREEEDWEEDWD